MTAGLAQTAVVHGFLNAIRGGGTNLTAPAATFLELHTGDPGAAGTSAVSVGDPTRRAFTQAAAASNAIALNGTPPVFTNGGTSETITHVAVWTLASGGTFLYSIALSASKAWVATDTLTPASVGVSLAPVAA